MTESRPIASPRQRRIRHMQTIVGRNIVWCGNGDHEVNSKTTAENGDMLGLSGFYINSRGSSLSSSAVTSRASSPSPSQPWDQHPPQQQRSKSTVLHRRTGSSPTTDYPAAAHSPSLEAPHPVTTVSSTLLNQQQHHNHHHHTADMRRSESASSLRSSNSTTVEDSSLTKSAYKTSRLKRPAARQHVLKQPQRQYSRDRDVERGLLDVNLTLHLSTDEAAFFKSETIPNTVNPSFRALDSSQWSSWYDGVQTEIVIRLWARHSFPESATAVRPSASEDHHHHHTSSASTTAAMKLRRPSQPTEEYQLLLEWQVDLNALAFVGKTLQDPPSSFTENTLLLEFEDGFYTAPDIVSKLIIQSKRSSLIDPYGENDQASIDTEHSVNKSKRSYSLDNLLKVNTLKQCIFDTQKSAEQVRQNISDILIKEDNRFRLARERDQRQCKLEGIEAELVKEKIGIRKGRQRIAHLRDLLAKRKSELSKSHECLEAEKEDLADNEQLLERSIQTHERLFHQLNRRKKELVADLFSIYPIEQSFDDMHQFCIRDIYLPNSVYTGCNDESIATALGFTAHLVSMLAFYLDIPLRYPIRPMGSRASIKDPVSSISGPTEFPLYAKGVDRYRFEFGVFLLNKNIEQLMNAYGLIVIDLRYTLPNIHYFIQAILTTSISSGPTSMSVLSISSYANQPGGDPTEATNSNNKSKRRSRLLRHRITPEQQTVSSAPAPASTTSSTTSHHSKGPNHQRTSSLNGSIKSPLTAAAAVSVDEHEQHGSNHLTLQPIVNNASPPVAPSPSTSTASVTKNISNSPKYGASPTAAFVGASQAMAAPPTLDTVTTISNCNSNNNDSSTSKQKEVAAEQAFW
ncbi:UV radiation resistance protein and autophagy-related subunit 14-domain-containing protein [Zychaea mexicana]|uniref:UV radiation resistance protein and autophagy-related subunit 14-domain-containing protein n=1 Tax=Zychaea mexicana TaxID=64656 RepID=UPI0022FDE266|nr:UV radiation resistance protein and autophagy-related subunit 14-domain-containing protein [Zychaea mexicana]KAI9496505.1 UV radiation resistance protein and autophagy-related subunit 14-domain-containing protein [Zychaea mexicana]